MKNKRQKRCTALLFCLLLCLAALPVHAEEETVTELQSRYRAMDALNELRTGLGLRTVTMVPELNDMAQNHSRYMNQNKEFSFLEKPANPGFTGISALDRMIYSGYEGRYAMEIRSLRARDYAGMLQGALYDPYQRYVLLHPGCDGIGFGLEKDYSCVVLGSEKNTDWTDAPVVYPFPGQQEVGNCSLRQLSQVPDEVRKASSRSQIGEPVTIAYYTAGFEELAFRNVQFTLTDTKRSRQVPVHYLLPQENSMLSQTLIVYPLELYNTDTRYEANVSIQVFAGEEYLGTIEQSWSYTSSGPDSIGEVSRVEALGKLARLFEVSQEPLEQEPEAQFADYPYDSSRPQNIMVYRLLEEGVLNFRTDGETLESAEGITREQMAVWMMKLLRKYEKTLYYSVHLDYENTFEDINKCSAEGKIAVQRAYLMGLVQDQGGGKFSPGIFITRTEFETWLSALQELLETAAEAGE